MLCTGLSTVIVDKQKNTLQLNSFELLFTRLCLLIQRMAATVTRIFCGTY